MAITLELIKQVEAETQCLTRELATAVALYAADESNSISDRAEALRTLCKHMPRKQEPGETDEQFVASYVQLTKRNLH